MEKELEVLVTFADRIDGHVLIEFDTGESGLYSGALLYSILFLADAVPPSGSEASPGESGK